MNEMQNLDLFDERDPWSELELEEPSKHVDAAILEEARRHRRTHRTRQIARRAVSLASGVLAAATLITVTLWWPTERTSSFYPSAVAEDLGTAVRQLRVDVNQIGEMSELVADTQTSQREEILARLAACQVRLKALEGAIAKDNAKNDETEGALTPTKEKKERRL